MSFQWWHGRVSAQTKWKRLTCDIFTANGPGIGRLGFILCKISGFQVPSQPEADHTLPSYPYHTIPCNTMQHHATPYAIPYHAIPYNTMQYHTIPYHAIPYNAIQNQAQGFTTVVSTNPSSCPLTLSQNISSAKLQNVFVTAEKCIC